MSEDREDWAVCLLSLSVQNVIVHASTTVPIVIMFYKLQQYFSLGIIMPLVYLSNGCQLKSQEGHLSFGQAVRVW